MREKEDRAGTAVEKARTDLRFVRKVAIDAWEHELTLDQIRVIEAATGNLLLKLGYPLFEEGQDL